MEPTDSDILSIWFENGGIRRMKIDVFITTFKLISIFFVTSIPFWIRFDKTHFDISDVTFSSQYWGVWLYYFITYGIMSWFIIKSLCKKVNLILKNDDLFHDLDINIDSTEGMTVEKLAETTKKSYETFMLEATRFDNVIIGLEDSRYIHSWVFNSLLGTLPFELTLKEILYEYFFKTGLYTFKNRDDNAKDFALLSKRSAFAIIPFLPTLVIFSLVNHIVTYINNGDYLTTYDYNRYGLWKFRYYNEFMFMTKKRLDKTKGIAEAVAINLYLESWKSTFSKGISFVFSVFTLFLLIFSFNGFERIWGMEIIPIMAILTGISSKIFPRARNQDGNIKDLQLKLSKDVTRKTLDMYFQSKLTILFKEVISILCLPIILYFIIPDRAFFITDFIITNFKDGICIFSKSVNQTNKTRLSSMPRTTSSSDILISL